MKTLKSYALIFVMALFTIASCEGPRGPQGPPGHDGMDGNANVQSATVETVAADWGWDDNSCNWYLDLEWDAIDLDMVDYGAVLVYMENPSDNFYGWHQLPLTLYPNDQYSASLETIYYDYALTIFWTNSDLQKHQNPCDFYGTDLTFKVVLIDASLYAQYQNENLSDYETVKKLLNIQDEK
ncbi:MAG: hypothetical protein IKY27_03020 [Bacteroidales bacterium]|nr:hypothetical protein [Bacteroidales bacterium]